MSYCKFCAVILDLNVSCQESGTTLDVTSKHFQVLQYDAYPDEARNENDEVDDWIAKRSADFGWPVGKGTFNLVLTSGFTDQSMQMITPFRLC
jgi:DNA-directed RNA polymerase II subunit RPB3